MRLNLEMRLATKVWFEMPQSAAPASQGGVPRLAQSQLAKGASIFGWGSKESPTAPRCLDKEALSSPSDTGHISQTAPAGV